jgi:hypothetical protein
MMFHERLRELREPSGKVEQEFTSINGQKRDFITINTDSLC